MLILSFALFFSSSIRLNTAYLLIMAFFLSAFLGENMVLHCFLNDKFLPLVNMKDVCTLQPLAPKRWGHQHSLALADFPLLLPWCEWLFTLLPYSGNGTFSLRRPIGIMQTLFHCQNMASGRDMEGSKGGGVFLGAEGRADPWFCYAER